MIEAGRRAIDDGEPLEATMLATLQRLERQGRLAMGGFAEQMREALVAPMDDLFAEYRQALTDWPHPLAEPLSVSMPFDDRLSLEDWLGELRRNDAGECCRVLLTTSSLIKKGRYQWRHWLGPWVAHLAGQLEGPMTTRLLSRAGTGTLAPLPADAAQDHLAAIAAAWQAGMASPLPLARDTAFAWLDKDGSPQAMTRWLSGAADEETVKAWRAAERAFHGDDYSDGERDRDPYLARQWRELEALVASAEGGGFAVLTERLYAPLLQAVKTRKDRDGQGGKA
jgi:exodeoxyribonuclease V gamma subunit